MSSKDDLNILFNILAEEGIESENLLKRFVRAKALGNRVSSFQGINALQSQTPMGNSAPISGQPMSSMPQGQNGLNPDPLGNTMSGKQGLGKYNDL